MPLPCGQGFVIPLALWPGRIVCMSGRVGGGGLRRENPRCEVFTATVQHLSVGTCAGLLSGPGVGMKFE